jgi:hypothetical protein
MFPKDASDRFLESIPNMEDGNCICLHGRGTLPVRVLLLHISQDKGSYQAGRGSSK